MLALETIEPTLGDERACMWRISRLPPTVRADE